jgi:hypothetical protein
VTVWTHTADAGRCPCGGRYEARLVEVNFANGMETWTDIPQGACPECGSRVYRAPQLALLEQGYKAAAMRQQAESPADATD